MTIPRKAKVGLGLLAPLLLVAGWQYVSYLFKYAYSRGTRTGVVRKISVKGPPYCKYLEGEMTLQGAQVGEEPATKTRWLSSSTKTSGMPSASPFIIVKTSSCGGAATPLLISWRSWKSNPTYPRYGS